jgi:hypothetical protein
MIDDGDCGAVGGMKTDRGNRSTRGKPAPAPLCSPQIPIDQTRARTRAAAVGSRRLTAWAMARPEMDACRVSESSKITCIYMWTVRLRQTFIFSSKSQLIN